MKRAPAATVPGTPFPLSMGVVVTNHARDRLIDRFPEWEFTWRDADRALVHLVRTGRMLTTVQTLKLFADRYTKHGGSICYNHDLGGILILKFEGQNAIVKTVFPAAVKPEFRLLFELEAA